MKARFALTICLVMASFLFSCGNKENNKNSADSGDKIPPREDGSFLLKLEEAACYSDQLDPSGNTAEWKFFVPGPGRYKVWLSSATRDTTKLGYTNSVKISLLDNQLEKNPECDKIVKNSGEVSYPYFRTDSDMGSFYFHEAGEYSIQVISEKVMANESSVKSSSRADNTKLVSLILVPMTR